jgi:hypothetical protein
VLDRLHLSMRVRHVAQTVAGWRTAARDEPARVTAPAGVVASVRWRLRHGQVEPAPRLIGETAAGFVDHGAEDGPDSAKTAMRLPGARETHVAGRAGMIIDDATARRRSRPIATRRPKAPGDACRIGRWARTSACAGRRAARSWGPGSGPPS